MGSKIVFPGQIRGVIPAEKLTPVGINGLSNATYTIGVGTSGTDVNVAAAGSTITVNIPDAADNVRGLLTTGSQSIAGLKTFRQISIVGQSNALELNIRAWVSGQTTPLTTWRDAGGTIIGSVSAIGEFDFGSAEFHVSAVGFFGVTPIARPTTAWAAPSSFVAGGGTAVTEASLFDGYTITQVVSILRAIGLLT